MKKKIVSVISAVTAFCTFIPALGAAFSDLDMDRYSWCYAEVEEMADAGYITGYEDGTFKPDSQVTKLEGIALFARAMGSAEDLNEDVRALAHEKYDTMLKPCSLGWGTDEVAYMLYKGAFIKSDLDTYLMGTAKNEPLSRGEAAVIMTKAMGGEEEATANMDVQLTYDDSESIPRNYLQYVQYVTEHHIMQGTDNEFRSSDTITRAQIAVMLKRAVDACQYSFIKAKLVGGDVEARTVTLNANGKETEYEYADNAAFNIKGETSDLSDMPENVTVIAQLAGDVVVSVDALSDEGDKVITAVYSGNSTSNGVRIITVKDKSTSTASKSYECASDVSVTYKGSPATMASLQSGDAVELVISDGKVQSINATEKIEKITGATVESLEISEDKLYMTISSSNSKYDGKKYEVADDATVKKSNSETNMSEVYEGDKVNLELRYGIITSVEATSTRGSASGTIVSILIATQPEITIRTDGKEKTYQVPVNCDITVNQKTGSVYDFRVGDNVTVTTVSNAVTKIQTSTAMINTEGGVSGTVSAVNTSYGFITVMTESSDVPFTVFKTANNTTYITSTGKTLDFKSIKAGDTVQCTGTTTNGAFVATLIIVTQAN